MYHWSMDNQTIPLVSISIVIAVPVYIYIYNWINILKVILVLACIPFPFRNQVWETKLLESSPALSCGWEIAFEVRRCVASELFLLITSSHLAAYPSIRCLTNISSLFPFLRWLSCWSKIFPKLLLPCRDAPTWPGIQINLPFA